MEFDSLNKLRPLVHSLQNTHPVTKPVVAPMDVLFNEKYKDKTIEIMHQLLEDAKLSGSPQVCMPCLPLDQNITISITNDRLSLDHI